MDYGATKNPPQVAAALAPYVPNISPDQAVSAAVKGRNNWIVWSGGNDRLWDVLSVQSAGILDFLKTVSSHPSLKYSRDNRWQYLGLVNEPCFDKGNGPRKDRYGLWLDVRSEACPARSRSRTKRSIPASGSVPAARTCPVGSYYGYATGVVGLRLFPNPDFDEAAAKRWDPERYYTDPAYYNDKKLVKPYRVGMSCGFCHVGPNPSNPPADPEHPKWENLNSNPGAQYFWVDRIFVWDVDESSFAYQLFHTSRPGALDTSFVSTDYMNNPRTMNSLYNFGARMAIGEKMGQGRARRRRAEQRASQQICSAWKRRLRSSTRPQYGMDAARSQGWIGFGRRPRRVESRLRQHRPVQRGMAGALQTVRRWHASSRRSRLRSQTRTRATGRRPRRRRPTWRCSSSPRPNPTT